MYYDKVVEAITIEIHGCKGEAVGVALEGIMNGIYAVANELHELNKNLKQGYDDGR